MIGGRRKGQARERLQECLERRRTGPQQYTTKKGAGAGGKEKEQIRFEMIHKIMNIALGRTSKVNNTRGKT